ncbi:DUF6194 family protein [Ahrensia sp. R2A130]|uniref:DUF6194 family protein n=1 Tax=Ahrensia sp. R2A130 TaxID=744979 RepID=UPI0001E0B494|nr:DUF6194 family protein [Ahrensia sp. R2A130]EFL89713.1 conserved hypothetical protein [Ahrensia sp. R2A130]
MTPEQIAEWLSEHFAHVIPKSEKSETSYFVNPDSEMPSDTYFASVMEKNSDEDRASGLDREGVFRIDFGPGADAFEAMFGDVPARPAKGEIIEGPWNFATLDTIMPHPVYGWMGWMCVLNPSRTTFHKCKPLLESAHARAMDTVMKRLDGAA